MSFCLLVQQLWYTPESTTIFTSNKDNFVEKHKSYHRTKAIIKTTCCTASRQWYLQVTKTIWQNNRKVTTESQPLKTTHLHHKRKDRGKQIIMIKLIYKMYTWICLNKNKKNPPHIG